MTINIFKLNKQTEIEIPFLIIIVIIINNNNKINIIQNISGSHPIIQNFIHFNRTIPQFETYSQLSEGGGRWGWRE